MHSSVRSPSSCWMRHISRNGGGGAASGAAHCCTGDYREALPLHCCYLNTLLFSFLADVLNFQFHRAAWAVNGNPAGSGAFMCVTVASFWGYLLNLLLLWQEKERGETGESHSQLIGFKCNKSQLNSTECSAAAFRSVVIPRPGSPSIIIPFCYCVFY